MASELSTPALAATSTETALCVIPPEHLWEPIDRLRSLYDKAYCRWPPHVNLVYPFVRPECLEQAARFISQIDFSSQIGQAPHATLSEPGVFTQRQQNTIHLRSKAGESRQTLSKLGNLVRHAIGREEDKSFIPHMTVAQSQDVNSASHLFLVEKVRALAEISWNITELAILIRDQDASLSSDASVPRPMKLWGYISLGPVQVQKLPLTKTLYPGEDTQAATIQSSAQTSYQFSDSEWAPLTEASAQSPSTPLDRLIVASYNVLGEFEWPPNQDRYPNIVKNILSDRGSADILILQEVTDHFLQFLLANEEIRSRFPYSTHGPPNQPEIGPLPNHLNIVVLSRFQFQWSNLLLTRKYKGAPIVTFPGLKASNAQDGQGNGLPLVLAACHLSHGLVDGAVTNKKNEFQRILTHLTENYKSCPWIIAGDFNMSTSSYTIEAARKRRDISSQSYRYLRDFDTKLAEAGLRDAWLASRIQTGESSASDWQHEPAAVEMFEGEQGATFDPQSNILAAKLVGSGLNNRPQRYDRILVNAHLGLRPLRFNMFGLPQTDSGVAESEAGASDHWGVRCLLQAPLPELHQAGQNHREQAMDIQLRTASPSLGGLEDLKRYLREQEFLPSEQDVTDRQRAIQLLQSALQCQTEGEERLGDASGPRLILVPAGSFGLGVWTRSSDVDVLCIGEITSTTFFKLAISRLRKAASTGITIIRRVRASSGIMLLLDVNGIKFDLHYCANVSILEQFPGVMRRPLTDPAFALPPGTLSKLKPVRDIFYIRRSIPDMSQYRAAHLLIKAWAKSRGLYGAKYGLLGGINISVLLVPVCKVLAHNVGSVSVADIVVSFFHHYAQVDWKTQMVFDPFFHKTINYRRASTEPLCLLGWHPPVLNTGLNASQPTVQTIASEFSRASSLLSDSEMTWDRFLGSQKTSSLGQDDTGSGAADFLQAFKVYARIDISYWGSSSRKRNEFVGWLESRCVMLLVDVGRRAPGFTARIWPQRFVDADSSKEAKVDDALDYRGCYLLGIERKSEEHLEGTLQAVLGQFEDRIRGDARHCDLDTSWVAATLVKRSELGNVQLDQSLIGEDAGADDLDDDFSSDEEEEDDEVSEALPIRQGPQHGLGSSTSKLRTALDVLNRLRWDPNMDSDDYIVGYEDRFTGACEKSLDMWKTDQTDDEFIPQHRILYFKRRSDNELMWERRSRLDKIFGSGVSNP